MKNIINLLVLVIFILGTYLDSASQTVGTRTEFNQNSAELIKRSSVEVDPTTNALNISIPLQEYPGRGGSFPVVLNYNSKVWRTTPQGCWTPPSYPDVPRARMNTPSYSEHSSSGWASSLAVPYIEEAGGSFTVWIDDNGVIQQNGQSGMPVDCGDEPTNSGCFENDPDCIFTPLTSYTIPRILVHMPGGGTHELRQNDTAYVGGGPGSLYYAVDGSRLKYDSTSQTLWMPDGSRYLMNSSTETQYIDRNGNKMTYNYTSKQWTDTVGRIFPQIGYNTEYLNLPKVGGTAQYQLHWELLSDSLTNPNEQLAYAGSNYHNGAVMQNLDPFLFGGDSPMISAPVIFDPPVLAQIDLPNGQSYKFSYNKYGEIDKVILPTGGYKRYRYAMVPAKQFGGGGNSFEVTNRGVVEMWESPNGDPLEESSHHWTFESEDDDSFYTTKTIAPDGTYTIRKVHSYDSSSVNDSPHWGFNHILDGRTLDESSYDSADAMRSRTLYTWTYDGPVYDPAGNCGIYCNATGALNMVGGGPGPMRNARLSSKIEIIVDSGSALAKTTTYEYDSDLNITAVNEYNFVPITATTAQAANPTISQGSLLRRQETTYYVNDPNLTPTARDAYRARNLVALPTSTRLKNASLQIVAQSAIRYDETSLSSYSNIINWTNPGSGVPRGNPTTVSQWLNSPNSWIESHAAYDQPGNIVSTTDALGKLTTFTFTDSFSDSVSRNSYAYSTLVTTPAPDQSGTHGSSVGLTTSAVYDFNTGRVVSTTDPNSQTTTLEYVDPLIRPTKVIQPNGHQTITEYGAGISASTRFVKVRSQIDAANWNEGYSWYDGFGRTVKTQSVDSNGDVFTLTCYDQYGRLSKTSNPFRNVSNPTCSSSLEWTTNTYDAAGKVWKVTTPDGAFVETLYGLATSGNSIGTAVTVKDQALKQRRSITNSLGQLTRVDEPDINNSDQLGSVDAPYQPTYYEYDILSNLTKVKQGGSFLVPQQTRTFVYDSLSRLKSAANPESGIISYNYDNNGNLTSRTDAREIETIYTYDALNRLITRIYDGEPSGLETPNVTYTYDDPNIANSKGKLTRVAAINGANVTSETKYQAFDILGRVTQSQQWVDGTAYGVPMTYTYNLSGGLIEQKYPSGRVVKNILDDDGELSIVQSKKNANAGYWDYAKNFTFTAAGAVSSMQLGNGKWESMQFNSRLQPTQIALGTVQNGTDKLKLNFEYGVFNWDGSVLAGTNNGNVAKQIITTPTTGSTPGFTATQYYTYDSLNRIKTAKENIQTQGQALQLGWQQQFVYDRYGNRTFDETNTTTLPKNCGTSPNFTVCPADNPAANTTNNRLNGFTFDDAGNTQEDPGGREFTYDGENKQIRVRDSSGNKIGEYFYDGDGKRVKKVEFSNNVATQTTVFVYDASSKMVAEYATNVEQVSTARVSYLTTDHLGSPRITTDKDGRVFSRRDFMPFGEELKAAQTSQRNVNLNYGEDGLRQKFTSYERDNETELDFAQARYYKSQHGRFTSTDPLYIELGRLTDPQKFNLYVYTRNNPLTFVDPSGLDVTVVDKTTDGTGSDEYKKKFNNRKKQKFQIAYDSNNKVVIVDSTGTALGEKDLKKLGKGLSGSEKELFDAITDTKNHAIINIVREDADVDFGRHDENGKNTIDVGDLDVVDNSGNIGFTSSQIVGHETLEAYKSITEKKRGDSHDFANKFFPGLGLTLSTYYAHNGKLIYFSINEVPIHNSSINVKITKQVVTPVPFNTASSGAISPIGSTKGHIVKITN